MHTLLWMSLINKAIQIKNIFLLEMWDKFEITVDNSSTLKLPTSQLFLLVHSENIRYQINQHF